MKKIITIILFTIITFQSFSQQKTASNEAILKVMNVRNGMDEINEFTTQYINKIDSNNVISFKADVNKYKSNLIAKAISFFKEKYSDTQITTIYNEATSNMINYSDVTNGFFRDWRRLKGNLFHKHMKPLISKYK